MHNEVQKNDIASVVPGVLDDAAMSAYTKALTGEKCDTTGGLSDVAACLQGAMLFDVVVNGQIVARYALQQFDRVNGTEICIKAAAGGLPGFDLTATITPVIEQQCAAADSLMINTKRKGLAKKLARQGWTIDAFVLRKKLNG